MALHRGVVMDVQYLPSGYYIMSYSSANLVAVIKYLLCMMVRCLTLPCFSESSIKLLDTIQFLYPGKVTGLFETVNPSD